MYGFLPARGMGYGVLEAMGYGLNFPANQLGGRDFLWGITGYGVSHIWVIAGSTVVLFLLVDCTRETTSGIGCLTMQI